MLKNVFDKSIYSIFRRFKCHHTHFQGTAFRSHLRTLQNEFNRLRNELQFKLNCIDFAHIYSIFLSSNDSLLRTHDSIQQKKFNKLLIENKPKQDPEIF